VLKKDDISATVKDIYFGLLGATSITQGATFTDIIANSTATFAADKDTLVPFSASSARGEDDGTGTIAFALAAATATTPGTADALAAGGKGIAAFQFYGELNTYAAWAASDIQVAGNYTLVPLRDTTYTTTLTSADYCADGVNQLLNGLKVDATIAGATGNASITYTAGTPVTIKFGTSLGSDTWIENRGVIVNLYGGGYDDETDLLTIDTTGFSGTTHIDIYRAGASSPSHVITLEE
jgi:hypothetical protein